MQTRRFMLASLLMMAAVKVYAQDCASPKTAFIAGTAGETQQYCVHKGMALLGDEVIGEAGEIERQGLPADYAAPILPPRMSWPGRRSPRALAQQAGELSALPPEHFGPINQATRLWPNNTVPYHFASDVLPSVRQAFTQAVAQYEKYTHLRFVPWTDEPGYLQVVNFDPSYSRICGFSMRGYHGKRQLLAIQSVADAGCSGSQANALHEIFHALGFSHYDASHNEQNYNQYEWLSAELDQRNIQAINLAYPPLAEPAG